MKTLEKTAWLVVYLFILVGFYMGATLAFMQGIDVIAWPMVLGGAWAIGMVGYYMLKEIFEI